MGSWLIPFFSLLLSSRHNGNDLDWQYVFTMVLSPATGPRRWGSGDCGPKLLRLWAKINFFLYCNGKLIDARMVNCSTEKDTIICQLERGFPAALEIRCPVVKWLGLKESTWELRLTPVINSRKPGIQSLRDNCKELNIAATTWVWKRTPSLTQEHNSYQALDFRVEGLGNMCLDSRPVHMGCNKYVLLKSLCLWQFVTQQ